MLGRLLVVGATGGVGQLSVAQALEQGLTVRVLTRNPDRARQMFGERVEIVVGDIRQPDTLAAAMTDLTYILCATGTTAFPSARWDFNFGSEATGLAAWSQWAKVYFDADYRQSIARNSPIQVDAIGVQNLVSAAPRHLQRLVFISSCGIERRDQFPYKILNAYGVLDAKYQGEAAIQASGIPYTIIRPGRLIDGPFTSSDLNTLLQATTQGKLGVILGTGDRLNGQTSRIDVAAAAIASLQTPATLNKTFELINQGPRPSTIDWNQLLSQLSESPVLELSQSS
jgi:uncharacterized protein YbjT (DUF2867 family)